MNGYEQVPHAVTFHPQLPLGAKAAYPALRQLAWKAGRRDERDEVVLPSQDKIAEGVGCSRAALAGYVRALKDAGFISYKRPSRRAPLRWRIFDDPKSREEIASLAESSDSRLLSGQESLLPRARSLSSPDVKLDGEEANASSRQRDIAVPVRRKRNLPFDALVEVCPGTDPSVDSGKVAAALKIIRRRLQTEAGSPDPRGDPARACLEADADPSGNSALADEIRRRALLYHARWEAIDITPTGLASNWTKVLTALPGKQRGMSSDEIRALGRQTEGATP